MILAEIVEDKKEALRVAAVARILDVSSKKIYRMAAKGQVPSLKISNSIRFDPHDIAVWLRDQSFSEPATVVPLPPRSDLTGKGNARRFNRASRI
jgi:predicted DNA-binding transcriptional regulator AlpA